MSLANAEGARITRQSRILSSGSRRKVPSPGGGCGTSRMGLGLTESTRTIPQRRPRPRTLTRMTTGPSSPRGPKHSLKGQFSARHDSCRMESLPRPFVSFLSMNYWDGGSVFIVKTMPYFDVHNAVGFGCNTFTTMKQCCLAQRWNAEHGKELDVVSASCGESLPRGLYSVEISSMAFVCVCSGSCHHG